MHNQLTIHAYAKINLTLDILGKRPDGYHDLEMVMQSVSLYDEVTLYLTAHKMSIIKNQIRNSLKKFTNCIIRKFQYFKIKVDFIIRL